MRHIHLRDRQISPKVSLCFDQRLQDWQLTDDPKQVTCKHCRRIMERREQEKRGEMIKEEILAMEAGDELNAAVAKIMEDDLEHQWEEGPSQSGVKYCSRCNTYDWMPAAERPCSVKLYSEDISAAWQVVEELGGAWGIKRRFRPRPDDPPGSPGRPTYQAAVQISDYAPYEDEFFNKWSGRSPWCWTLPEAICKAALLAKQNKN